MYKLLLVTDDAVLADQLYTTVDWHSLGFHRPNMAANAAEATKALESKVIDAVGCRLHGEDSKLLMRYLRYGRPSLPLFRVEDTADKQAEALRDLSHILDKLVIDDADAYYDQETMLLHVRDEFVHRLLCGEISDWNSAERTLASLRSQIDPFGKVLLYDIDMPQGELYMQEHNDPARRMNRLERALRNNFFGRCVDGACYAVAVTTPRHIRLAALRTIGNDMTDRVFRDTVDAHIADVFKMVRNYLDLEMDIKGMRVLESARELTENERKE